MINDKGKQQKVCQIVAKKNAKIIKVLVGGCADEGSISTN